MENGSAFAAFLEETTDALNDITLVDYYGQPIPAPLDETFNATVRRFLGETAVHQTQFQAGLTHVQRTLFGAFGHRAATIAARTNDAEMLRLGLVGTAIANYEIPPSRRVAVGLSIFYHVARQLKLNPIDLFEDVAQLSSPAMQNELLRFGRNGQISLTQFGWRERKTEDGIRFERG